MKLLPNKHIIPLFIKNGGAFAVTGIDGGIVGQAEESFLDAPDERLKVAARKVGAAYAAAKEGIARENPAFNLGIKTDAAFSVTWGTNDLQCAFAYLDDFTVLQVVVRQFAFIVERQSEQTSLLLRTKEVAFHIRMGGYWDVVFTFEGGVAEDVVDVAMGVDDHQWLQPMAVYEAEELVFFAWG